MKNLVFIDNDSEERSKEDVSYIKNTLELQGKLSESYIEALQIISNAAHIDSDKLQNIIYDPNNCICTWSMYTYNHYGSAQQLLGFLRKASINQLENHVYIDASGMIVKFLERYFLSDGKHTFDILCAISKNYILTKDYEINDDSLLRLNLNIQGRYDNPFVLTPVSLIDLLK